MTEHDTLQKLLSTLKRNGATHFSVVDDEGLIQTRTINSDTAIKAIESVEECILQVWDDEARIGSVALVLGNAPDEIVSDCSQSLAHVV